MSKNRDEGWGSGWGWRKGQLDQIMSYLMRPKNEHGVIFYNSPLCVAFAIQTIQVTLSKQETIQ